MLKSLFSKSPAKAAGAALYRSISAAARRPAFYLQGGAPDTPEGRFEVYLLHLVLVLLRLKGRGEAARAVSQAAFDAFLRGLDDGLREMGVGDLSVGKKMRKLGEAIYGRLRAYEEALGAPQAEEAVRALLVRTLYADGGGEAAPFMSAYVLRAQADLAVQELAALLAGSLRFPPASAEEIAA